MSYYPSDEDKTAIRTAIIILALTVAAALLASCTQSQTREQIATDKVDKISVSGTMTIPTTDGPRPVPISFTIDRRGYEDQRKEADTRTGVDGAAVGREIAAVLGPVLAGATGGGFSWTSILAGVGGAATAATTGYLALKKREQLKPAKRQS